MTETEQLRRGRSSNVKDARGRSVTFLDPYELNLLRRHDVMPSETLQSIADGVGFGAPKWQRRGYIACVSIFLMGLVSVLVIRFYMCTLG